VPMMKRQRERELFEKLAATLSGNAGAYLGFGGIFRPTRILGIGAQSFIQNLALPLYIQQRIQVRLTHAVPVLHARVSAA
jgi:hypothetical protein